jgi:hypothetical protein
VTPFLNSFRPVSKAARVGAHGRNQSGNDGRATDQLSLETHPELSKKYARLDNSLRVLLKSFAN